MKTQIKYMAKGVLVLVTLFLVTNCKTNLNQTPNELIGNWETQNTPITFRTKIRWMKYHFIKSNTLLVLHVNANKTVSGSIGNAKFNDAQVFKNKVASSISGISFIIRCGEIGQINDEDSPNLKTIELWVKPIQEKRMFTAEIRLIDGWDTFPMGEATFYLKQ